jgi:hypothetical protein
MILHGKYEHKIFSAEKPIDEILTASDIYESMVRDEGAGCLYSLNEKTLHTALAEPGSVSLVLRGPANLERSLKIDRATDSIWWHYGAGNDKTIAAKKNSAMSRHHLLEKIAYLHRIGVLL